MQAASIPVDRRRSTAMIALADGRTFAGRGFGHAGTTVGELVFNTAMTGYQEILSDPSYSGQIITFTFPHIGIVGVNDEDFEAHAPAASGLIVRSLNDRPSNWRHRRTLDHWCQQAGLIGIAGVDTRALTNILRDEGAQRAALTYNPLGHLHSAELQAAADAFAGMDGADLVPGVTANEERDWLEADWQAEGGYKTAAGNGPHVVVVDYGIKNNILRLLADTGCRLTVVPATTSAERILALRPAAIVLSNGPGDPAATGQYAVPEIRRLVASGTPMMGICLGHQMLGLALGATTQKMPFGHHGANHPVMDLRSGKVEITSQNHGFAIAENPIPDDIEVTHRSLFDGTVQGIALRGKPVFSVQYHPEASPGPMDSRYLFDRLLQHASEA